MALGKKLRAKAEPPKSEEEEEEEVQVDSDEGSTIGSGSEDPGSARKSSKLGNKSRRKKAKRSASEPASRKNKKATKKTTGGKNCVKCLKSAKEVRMFDDEQCVRCTRLAGSFYGKTLPELVHELETERDPKRAAAMQSEWDEADKNLKAIEEDPGHTLTFSARAGIKRKGRCGYRMSARYLFLTNSEVLREFAVEPKVLGLKTCRRWNEEHSRKIEGVCFKAVPGDELKYRILEYFYEQVYEDADDIMLPEERLRENQIADTMTQLHKLEAAEHPAAPRRKQWASTPDPRVNLPTEPRGVWQWPLIFISARAYRFRVYSFRRVWR